MIDITTGEDKPYGTLNLPLSSLKLNIEDWEQQNIKKHLKKVARNMLLYEFEEVYFYLPTEKHPKGPIPEAFEPFQQNCLRVKKIEYYHSLDGNEMAKLTMEVSKWFKRRFIWKIDLQHILLGVLLGVATNIFVQYFIK